MNINLVPMLTKNKDKYLTDLLAIVMFTYFDEHRSSSLFARSNNNIVRKIT